MLIIHNTYFRNIFFTCVGLIIAGLVCLSFFNMPIADDFFALSTASQKSWTDIQVYIYKNWGGRFTSNFFAASFSVHNFLFQHYYLHTLLLLVLQLYSIYFFIASLNKYIINKALSQTTLYLVTGILFLVFINIIPQINTAFFWFSSSVTYQFSLIGTLLTFGFLIKAIKHKKHQTVYYTITSVLMLLTIGTNEFAAMSVLLLSVLVYGLCAKKQQLNHFKIIVVLCFGIVAMLISVISPGNQIRLHNFQGNQFPIVSILSSLTLRIIHIHYSLFSSGFFWLSLVVIFCLAIYVRTKILLLKHVLFSLKNVVVLHTIWVIFLVIIILPILFFTQGSIPTRAINFICQLTALTVICQVFYWGLCIKNETVKQLVIQHKFQQILFTIFTLNLVFNSLNFRLVCSIISAPIYKQALANRYDLLEQATNKQDTAINISSVQASMKKIVDTEYSSSKKILNEIRVQPPEFLFVFDDVLIEENKKLLEAYYKLKSIKATN